jgi:hypothetical protein
VTTTVTVEVDEDELTAAAGLLGTSSREETLRKLVANAAARAANVALSVPRLLSVRPPTGPRIGDRSRVPD